VANPEIDRLRAEMRAARETYEQLRREAATIPGFEILADPVGRVTTTVLAESLAEEEALVVLVPHPDAEKAPETSKASAGYMWVLRRDGVPRVLTCGAPDPSDPSVGAEAMLEEFEAYCREVEGRQGGVRKGGAVCGPPAAQEAPLQETPATTDPTAFWPGYADRLGRMIWAPLAESGMLEGARRVTVSTVGLFHNLPLGAGRDAHGLGDLEIRHASALPLLAMARELYTDPEAEDAAPPAQEAEPGLVALVHDPAQIAGIPLSGEEIDLARTIWTEARGEEAVLSGSGLNFGQPMAYGHIACHGDVDDAFDPPRVLLKLEDGLGEQAFARAPVSRDWLMTACVVGRGFDHPEEGATVGLVSAALQRGARSVVAFLPPVPDWVGYLTGIGCALVLSRAPGLSLPEAAERVKRALTGSDAPELRAEIATALARASAAELQDALRDGFGPDESRHFWAIGVPEITEIARTDPLLTEGKRNAFVAHCARHLRLAPNTPTAKDDITILKHALITFQPK
jgi:hypothetical protein